jgi:hypothetical protein
LIKRRLWVAAALAPLTFAAASQAVAQAVAQPITGAITAPVATSTSGDITINAGASVTITPTTAATSTGQNAVTIDSAGNSVTNNGAISSAETTAYSDTNGDGILDSNTTAGATAAVVGQYAVGSNRFGILTLGLQGGSITNTGTITVIGENSAGIYVGAGGLNGALSNSGTITATGGDLYLPGTTTPAFDVTYGIFSSGAILGPVSITGAVSATGQNAQAVSLGQIGAAASPGSGLTISSALTATGYRATTAPTYVGYLNLLFLPAAQTTAAEKAAPAGELQQGGPALNLGGSIFGGINITAANSTVTPVVTEGAVTAYGSAPALLIGGSNAINIGQVTGLNYGLEIDGAVTGAGTYQGVNGTAIQIGGLNPLAVTSYGAAAGAPFGNVTIAGGINITGTVAGSALTEYVTNGTTAANGTAVANASAIGLHIGQGANVPAINVNVVNTGTNAAPVYTAGSLTATVSTNSAPTLGANYIVKPTATALQIDSGATVNSITNTGTIAAVIQGLATSALNGVSTTAGGQYGTATAISDQSAGAVTITNSRTISAAVTPPVGTTVDPSARTIAINLQDNTGGATVIQNANSFSTAATPIVPTIVGDILFGSGASSLQLNAGTDTGAVSFGASLLNTVSITGGATLTGAVTTNNGGALAVSVTNGELFNTSTQLLTGSTLTLGAKGSIIFSVNPLSPPTGPLMTLSGASSLANGAGVGLNFLNKLTTSTSYTVLQTTGAGTLSVGAINPSLNGLLPYFYSATVAQNTPGALVLNVGVKTPAQLGLTPGEAGAYNAIYQAFSSDPAVNAALLSKTDKATFTKLYDQFLPDYSGGPFESLVSGQQALQRTQADAPLKLASDEGHGWVEEISIVNHHDNTDGGGYQGNGFGLVGGVEGVHGDNAFGVTAAFLTTTVQDASQTNLGSVTASAIEGGVYWRASADGLNVSASANGGWVNLGSHRLLYDATQAPVLDREATASWNGALASGGLRASYQIDLGRFYIRPELAADYVLLYESAFVERGGGPALDLAVGSQTNQQASAQADMVFGANFGTTIHWRPELTLGWRDVVSGGPANTTAHFVDGNAGVSAGQTFTLSPNFQDKGGLLARLGVRAGGNYADFSADAGGQFANGYQTYDARAVARFLF